jgi:hypothetical protein
MSKRITRMISISRDNIMQFAQAGNFFDAVPELAHLKPNFDECRAAFDASAKKHGCRCRADTGVLYPCVSAFLTTLEEFKTTNPDAVQKFIRFVAKDDNIESTGVTIYYAPPNVSAPMRYAFP